MAERGRPQHNEMFSPNRVPMGEVLTSEELARRMCHELQIPQRFNTRIYKAISRVFADALSNGEGIRIQDIGVLRLNKYNKDTVHMPDGSIIPRTSMFKVVFELTKKGKKLLVELTKRLSKEAKEVT
jgi:nucleoid DNA-binding protein